MTSSPHPGLQLSVAVPTFRRAERLAALLPLVDAHVKACLESGLIDTGALVVVDNDPEHSAEPVVASFESSVPVAYVHQPTPGIPAVRNAAMDAARESRLLAFIDDDETPREHWLSALVETWNGAGCPTGVSGLVVSHFPPDTDPWILASGLFKRSEMPTGTPMPVVATGNLLLDLDAVRAFGVRFDESIGLGGGSDTMFSTSLSEKGARFVWCNESVADDPVETSRLTRDWVLRRAFSHGNAASRVALEHESSRRRRLLLRLRATIGGTGRIVVGSARRLWGKVTGNLTAEARSSRLMWRGAGMISGAYGHRFHAYAHDRKKQGV